MERSVKVTKEAQKSQKKQSDSAATVEQNIPQAAPQPGGAGWPESSDQSDKKEEQTNYEINSKTTATTRNGYRLEKLSIAVVVNRGRIAQMVGEPVDQQKIDAYLAQMKQIVSTAAGINAERGDVVTVTAMDFLENQLLDQAAANGPGIGEMLTRNMGGIINSAAFVLVAFLVVWFGLRPVVRSMTGTAVSYGNSWRSRRSGIAGLLTRWCQSGSCRRLWCRFRLRLRFRQFQRSLRCRRRSERRLQPPCQGRTEKRLAAWSKSAKSAPPRSCANGQ